MFCLVDVSYNSSAWPLENLWIIITLWWKKNSANLTQDYDSDTGDNTATTTTTNNNNKLQQAQLCLCIVIRIKKFIVDKS